MPTAKRAKTVSHGNDDVSRGHESRAGGDGATCLARFLTSLFVITYAVATANDSATCASETRLAEQ
jgi:hypothetical protein